MNISGTNKNDNLFGTTGADVIDGKRGSDRIDGGAGDDTLIGGDGADVFVLSAGSGNDVVTDFNASQGDRILFNVSSYSDYMIFSQLADGMTWQDFTGGTTFLVQATDVNNDGVTDTTIWANGDSLTLLGLSPDQVSGWSISGG